MGLYSSEPKECGCEIRRYTGGKIIIIGCKNHPNSIEYICPTCKKRHTTEILLKECRWSHAL